ncbi:MAG TPA: hypothetical protein VGF13_00565 [Verrucomicrobiae bacterium]
MRDETVEDSRVIDGLERDKAAPGCLAAGLHSINPRLCRVVELGLVIICEDF